jgi:hypothetical protein
MQDSFHSDNPKTIWQNQQTEASTMTLKLIQRRARELRAKTRRALLGTLAGPLAVAFCYTFCIKMFPAMKPASHLLFTFALAWSLAGLYFLNRRKWSAAMPGDAGFSAGLEFCRREIERQRDYFRRVLLWSFGPMLLALATLILAVAMFVGRENFPKAMPFMTIIVVWIAAYFVIRARDQRRLQLEIDELNDIERENR